MFSWFVNRRPWAAVIVSVFLGPFIGMFYLGKGRAGLAYLLLWYTGPILPVYFAQSEVGAGLLVITVHIAGIFHCYFVAKNLAERPPGAWFAR